MPTTEVQPSRTLNLDIVSIVGQVIKIAIDLHGSQTANVIGLHPADAVRIKSYSVALKDFLKTVQGNPLMDRPETTPNFEVPLQAFPALPQIENQPLMDCIHIMHVTYLETVASQSSRWGNKLLTYDYARTLSYIERLDKLVEHMERVYPLDMPESSPMHPVSQTGYTGLEPGGLPVMTGGSSP